MEDKIIKSCVLSREAWEALVSISGYLDEFSDLSKIILDVIASFYKTDPQSVKIDIDLLESKLKRKHPKAFNHIISILKEELSSPINVINEFIEVKMTRVRGRMIEALSTGMPNQHLDRLIEEYQNIAEMQDIEQTSDIIFSDVRPEDLLNNSENNDLIKLYPNSLNDKIGGGIEPESVILVFGRPDSGKTAFVINQLAGSCRDGHKVLYIGNEDPTKKMLQRILSRMSNMTIEEMKNNMELCYERAVERGYRNLIFAPLTPGSMSDIDRLVNVHNPKLLIVDQLRNIIADADGQVTQLEAVAKGARRIAKSTGCVAFCTTQANDSATGKLVITMSDVDGSKTGMPGQADLMIGIGSNDEYKNSGRLMLSICKNKVNGEYAHIPVRMNKYLSKILS